MGSINMLRRKGYDGPVTIISADDASPYDRPNVSKDYLQEPIPDDWMNLRVPDFYREQRIDLVLNARVSSLEPLKSSLPLLVGRFA